MNKAKYLNRDQIKDQIDRLTYDPNSFDSLSNLAEHHVKLKEYQEAILMLDQLMEYFGPTPRLYLNKSLCQYRIQEYNDAIESLELALSLEPEFEEAIKLKSMIKEKLDKLRKYYGVQMYQ